MSEFWILALIFGSIVGFMILYFIVTELAVTAIQKGNEETRERIRNRLEELAERSYERRMKRREQSLE